MENWLKPLLIENNAPSWIYNSFTFYAIIYVAAGLISTWIVQSMKPKTENEKELLKLRKKDKNSEKDKNKEIQKALSTQADKHNAELTSIKESHRVAIRNQRAEHDKEITTHLCKIRAKDTFIELMTAQLAEKFEVIDSYNKETSNVSNNSRNSQPITDDNIIPDIGNYS